MPTPEEIHEAIDAVVDDVVANAKTFLSGVVTGLLEESGAGDTLFSVVSQATISVNDASDTTLVVPPGSIGAVVQTVMDAGQEAGFVYLTLNGLSPTPLNAVLMSHGDSADLGRTPSQPTGDVNELTLAKFKASSGVSASLQIVFYEVA